MLLLTKYFPCNEASRPESVGITLITEEGDAGGAISFPLAHVLCLNGSSIPAFQEIATIHVVSDMRVVLL